MPDRIARVLMALSLMSLALFTASALAAPPKVGDQIPAGLALTSPPNPLDRQALGLADTPVFKLADLKATLLIVEVLGVYCPLCHAQAPLFDKFYARLNQDPQLSGKVLLLGLAAGATKEEVEYLRESGAYTYPVAYDPEYGAHKQLGEPKTPFTMILDAKGRVLYAHLGVIEDMNAFYEQLRRLAGH